MHELSLVNSLLELIDDYARRQSIKKVNCLYLSMGSLSCIDKASLQFAFEVQSQGTITEGARLAIDVLPAALYCFACDSQSQQDRFEAVCPKCGSTQVTLTGGTEELRLIELDVD